MSPNKIDLICHIFKLEIVLKRNKWQDLNSFEILTLNPSYFPLALFFYYFYFYYACLDMGNTL